MRDLPSSLAAHLISGATTLCQCWRLTCANGAVSGFTDHDRDIAFGGVTYQASTFSGAGFASPVGLAAGGSEVSGALSALGLTEADLAAGVYDGARLEIWLVNWSALDDRVLLDAGTIGEVRRGSNGFTAEVRSLAALLDQETGRLYQAACSADLGDARCAVALDGFTATATVANIAGDAAFTAALAQASGWFTDGRVTFTSGAIAGAGFAVKQHTLIDGVAHLALWTVPDGFAVGDAFAVSAGCDKSWNTCRAKFANGANFRGFPHMPGNDRVMTYPWKDETGLDGGSVQA